MIDLEILARKTDDGRVQTLQEHSQNTAKLCSQYLQSFSIPNITFILGEIHDFGKACEAFAQKLSGKNISVEHSTSGAVFLLDLCINQKDLTPNAKCILQCMAVAISCHHTGLTNMADHYQSRLDELYTKLNDLEFLTNYNQMLNNCADDLNQIKRTILTPEFNHECDLVWRHIMYISSSVVPVCNTEVDKANLFGLLQFYLSMFIRLLYSTLIDADRTDAHNFEMGDIVKANTDCQQAFLSIANYMDESTKKFPHSPLNDIRSEIYNECIQKSKQQTGLFELNVPTGGGKTRTSFRFALGNAIKNKLNKIIYVVPFISIIEQNAQVVRNILKSVGYEQILVESHSNAVTYTETTQDEKFDKFFSTWDEPVIFTTMVSFLESVYSKPSQNNRRFHNLANSVIIFDEVQALPKKCVGLFNLLIKFLQTSMHCTIVLCSATQPTLSRLGEYSSNKQAVKPLCLDSPIKLVSQQYPELKRTQIIFENDTPLDLGKAKEYILHKFESVQNLLVIVNTKRAAKELFLVLKEHTKCYHLSTNMCAQHRLDKIDTIRKALQNHEKFILVSTQLIEAGVDVDFECVIRSECGVDSLIQSAGRCNREGKLVDNNGNKCLGNVYVVKLANSLENIQSVVDIVDSQRYMEACQMNCEQRHEEITSKASIDQYFNLQYSKVQDLKYICSGNTTLVDELMGKKSNLSQKNDDNKFRLLTMNFKTVTENFRVIDQQNTVSVLVPYKEGKQLINNLDKLNNIDAKKCQRFLVQMQIKNNQNSYSQYRENTGIWYLTSGYDDDLGVTDEIQKMEFDGGFFE